MELKSRVLAEEINRHYTKYSIRDLSGLTMENVCSQKGPFTLQAQQKFRSNYIAPKGPGKRFLAVDKPGIGKTCLSIAMAEHSIDEGRHVFICTPRPLIENYENELRTECAKDRYITRAARENLKMLDPGSEEWKAIIRVSNEKISKNYTIITHMTAPEIIEKAIPNLKKPPVIIIDEVHKIAGIKSQTYQAYETLLNKKVPADTRVILLTGTPIMDKPIELAAEMNLILPEELRFNLLTFYKNYIEVVPKEDRDGNEFATYKIKNNHDLLYRFYGHVGFYQGLGHIGFAKIHKHPIDLPMKDLQQKVYTAIDEQEQKTVPRVTEALSTVPNNFQLGTRQASNIVYPNGQIGNKGEGLSDYIIKNSLDRYSIKFEWIVLALEKLVFPAFIYSFFVESGVQELAHILSVRGFRRIEWDAKKKGIIIPQGDGPLFVALTSKDEHLRKIAIEMYNDPKNVHGEMLAFIIGSSVLATGFSLKRTRTEVIVEPSWDWPFMHQIEQRGARFCGHVDLPPNERTIDIFYLRSTQKKEMSIDLYMYKLADIKKHLSDQFMDLLWMSSVDCQAFKVPNEAAMRKKINCYLPPHEVTDDMLVVQYENKDLVSERVSRHTNIRFTPGTTLMNQEDYQKVVKYIKYALTVSSDGTFAEEEEKMLSGTEIVIHTYATTAELNKNPNLIAERGKVLKNSFYNELGLRFQLIPPLHEMHKALGQVVIIMDEKAKEVKRTAKLNTDNEIKLRTGITKVKPKIYKGCPEQRRPVNGKCPENYPYPFKNKKGYTCCYNMQGGKNEVIVLGDIEIDPDKGLMIKGRRCMNATKGEIIQAALEAGAGMEWLSNYSTKASLCQAVLKYVINNRKSKHVEKGKNDDNQTRFFFNWF